MNEELQKLIEKMNILGLTIEEKLHFKQLAKAAGHTNDICRCYSMGDKCRVHGVKITIVPSEYEPQQPISQLQGNHEIT